MSLSSTTDPHSVEREVVNPNLHLPLLNRKRSNHTSLWTKNKRENRDTEGETIQIQKKKRKEEDCELSNGGKDAKCNHLITSSIAMIQSQTCFISLSGCAAYLCQSFRVCYIPNNAGFAFEKKLRIVGLEDTSEKVGGCCELAGVNEHWAQETLIIRDNKKDKNNSRSVTMRENIH